MGEMLRSARKWIIVDALVLLGLSGYELVSRLDAIQGPLKMFVNMAVGEKIPLDRVALYVDMSIFELPAFMLLSMLAGLVALIGRTSKKGCILLLPLSAALTVWGTFIQLSILGEFIRFAKVLPLLILFVLSLSCLVLHAVQRRQLRAQAQKAGRYAGYAPVQPQKMEGRRFQYGIEDHPRRASRRRRVS